MTVEERALAAVERLKACYPQTRCSLDYDEAWKLLVSVRLSAQCTDERVNKITPALFERFPTLEAFAQADPEEVGQYIHSCGFFNTKSRDLVNCAKMKKITFVILFAKRELFLIVEIFSRLQDPAYP